MRISETEQDAVIIGGGFYGAVIALYLMKQRGLKKIVLLEREQGLLRRASYNNQARVHNGYHYPRSVTTAYRSRVNFPSFVYDWSKAVKQDFTKLYGISRFNSKLTANQFLRFCREIGADIQPADRALKKLFNPRLIESVFLVKEYCFDAVKLALLLGSELKDYGVQVHFETQATEIKMGTNGGLQVRVKDKNGMGELISSRYVFNCTYSGLNQFKGDFRRVSIALKHEISEMALLQVPTALKNVGVTIMDGSFFSVMPFPSRPGLHTLSHVRYTPHTTWADQSGVDPCEKLLQYKCETHVERMIRDAGRYMPTLLDSKYVKSLFETKTILVKNEGDDGRPILFEKHEELVGCFSVLGGKIDNIYDVLKRLDSEEIY